MFVPGGRQDDVIVQEAEVFTFRGPDALVLRIGIRIIKGIGYDPASIGLEILPAPIRRSIINDDDLIGMIGVLFNGFEIYLVESKTIMHCGDNTYHCEFTLTLLPSNCIANRTVKVHENFFPPAGIFEALSPLYP